MARVSDQLSQSEMSLIDSYARQINLETDDPYGEKNANEIVDYFINIWKEDINATTLPLAVQ